MQGAGLISVNRFFFFFWIWVWFFVVGERNFWVSDCLS